jgi:hypothetical protein
MTSVTTTTAMIAASANENDGPWGAVNNVCHIVDGDDARYKDAFDSRDSVVGMALNSSAMASWSVLYELLFGRVPFGPSLLAGAATAAGAYLVDYHVVPKRFTPGIEHKISRNAIFSIYVVLGLTYALSPLWKKGQNT